MVLDTIWRYEFDMLWIWGYDFDMILIWFWYDFDTILIRFWYDFDTVLRCFQCVGFKKRNRNSPGTCFWSIFRRSLWFDTLLISLCTFPLWNGLTHVPFQGHFSNKRMHFVRTFFWSTMPFCKKRVFLLGKSFCKSQLSLQNELGANHFITQFGVHFRQCKKGYWNLGHVQEPGFLL